MQLPTRTRLTILAVLLVFFSTLSGSHGHGQSPPASADAPEIPSREEHDKELMFYALGREFAVHPDELPDKMRAARRGQDQLVRLLTKCVGIHPTNRQEELIAEDAALMLSQYRGALVLPALADSIDLRADRFANVITSSSEGSLGYVMRYYPCVYSLIVHGEPAVEPIIRAAVSLRKDHSDLELELAAYTLIEIRCHVEDQMPKAYLAQSERSELIVLVERQFEEFEKQKMGDEQAVNTLKRFLRQVEPLYYRYQRAGEKNGLGPAEGSAIFRRRAVMPAAED